MNRHSDAARLATVDGAPTTQAQATEKAPIGDATTGDGLWGFPTGRGIVGRPIPCEQDGERCISAISGWSGEEACWVDRPDQEGRLRPSPARAARGPLARG